MISFFRQKDYNDGLIKNVILLSTLYGFTKNKTTGEYLLVLQYFQNGDLRKQLQRQATDWKEKIFMIYRIAFDMKEIHDAGMIHR